MDRLVYYVSKKGWGEKKKVWGGWCRAPISPVRDHNELPCQVFPLLLEVNCWGHTQRQEVSDEIQTDVGQSRLLTN